MSGRIVGGGSLLNRLPIIVDDGIPVGGIAVSVLGVRSKGVEIQVGPSDLIAAIEGTLTVAELVMIVNVTPE